MFKLFSSETLRNLIQNALIENEGNQRAAARALGMPKSTLHDYIKRLDLGLFTKKNMKAFSDAANSDWWPV